jgi:TPR repeat protein
MPRHRVLEALRVAKMNIRNEEDALRLSSRQNFHLAQNYFEEKNYVEAVKLYKLAAELGCSASNFMLSVCYDIGYGVMKDHEEAKRRYEISDRQAKFQIELSRQQTQRLKKLCDEILAFKP